MGDYIGRDPLSANLLRDYFSGNGSQLVFTLTYAPSGNFGIFVFVNGVMQPADHTSYNVVGNTLTFVEAPAFPAPGVTNNIEILYLTLGNTSSSSGVTGSGIPMAQATTGDTIAYTATYSPAIASLNSDTMVAVRVTAPNSTSTPTFSPNGLTAKSIRKANNVRLLPGDLSLDHILVFSSTLDSWVLVNPTRGYGNAAQLTNLLHPTNGNGWRDVINSGWLPTYFNQQWGGAISPFEIVDDSTNVPYKFDSAAAIIESDPPTTANLSIADVVGNTWRAQGFKVGKAINVSAVWIKLYKNSGPANDLQLYILPDDGSGTKPTGSTPITNGTATAIQGKIMSSDAQWHRFVFPTPPALSANTVYHIAVKSSGVVDASNYWKWGTLSTTFGAQFKYPYGFTSAGNASGPPTWTADATKICNFIVEPSSADTMLQSGGQFEQKLVFSQGNPISHSGSLSQPLANFFDDKESSLFIRGSTFTKDKTILDCMYGIDHDRILLRCNVTTGFAQLDVFDSTGTKRTVTGTVDISSGYHDIAIWLQSNNSGADRIQLFVNGVSDGTALTGLTYGFDPMMKQFGTAWLGGGFNLPPTWTQKLNMTVLPSADSPAWTFAGTGTEVNSFLVSGGRLYQTGDIAGATTGYYTKTALSLSNANGWTVVAKLRVKNTVFSGANNRNAYLEIKDGSKTLTLSMREDNMYHEDGARTDYSPARFREGENVLMVSGKGNDFYVYLNGKLVIDGSGGLLTATATNSIIFGHFEATAANVTWDYVAYYNTNWLSPEFTSGTLSEFASWSGDARSVQEGAYNSGAPVSIRNFLGLTFPYVKTIPAITKDVKIITSVTTASTTNPPTIILQGAQAFVIGSDLKFKNTKASMTTTNATTLRLIPYINGTYDLNDLQTYVVTNASGFSATLSCSGITRSIYFGLHKCELRWSSNDSSPATALERIFEVEGNS